MAIPSILQQMTARWKPEYDTNTRLRPAKVHFERVIKAQESLVAKQADLAKNRDLSETGRASQLRTFAEKEVVPTIAKAIRAIDQNEGHLQRRRKSLLPTVKDPTNVADAILRAQMRDHLASLKPGERMALLHAKDADPRLIECVVEAPLALSGLTQLENDNLMRTVIERANGPAAAAIADEAEALALVRAVTQMATNDLAKTIAFPHAKAFSDWMDATAEAAGVMKNDDPEIAALSVNALADDAAALSPAARRSLIDTLHGQQEKALT